MKVREADLGKVLLSVINDMHLRPGGVVTLQTLAAAWDKVGLRAQDLQTGIAQLIGIEFLCTVEVESEDACYALSETGHKKALSSASAVSLIASPAQRLRRTTERRRKKAIKKPQEMPSKDRRDKPKG